MATNNSTDTNRPIDVADGGTGATTLGDGYVLLGSGTGAITGLDVTAKGSILVGDGTTDPVALAVGTNDYVLTADSAEASGLKWAAAAGGGSAVGCWRFIEKQTISSDTTIDFTGFINSAYDNYVVVFDNVIPATDDVDLQVRMGTGATPTWDSGSNYQWERMWGGVDTANTGQTEIQLSMRAGSDTAEYGCNGYMYLYNPSGSSYTFTTHSIVEAYAFGGVRTHTGGGAYASTTAVTGLRFFFSSGNLESGTITLYGITNTTGGGSDTMPDADLVFSAKDLSLNTTTAEAPLNYVDLGTVEVLVRSFANGTEQYCQGGFVVPADIDTGGTVTFEVRGWSATAAASKNTAWTFGYRSVADGEDFDGSYTDDDSGDLAVSATQDYLDVLSWTETVSNLGWAAGDAVQFRVSRPAASADDLASAYYMYQFRIRVPQA